MKLFHIKITLMSGERIYTRFGSRRASLKAAELRREFPGKAVTVVEMPPNDRSPITGGFCNG